MLPDCAPPPRSCARARPAIGGEGQALAGGGVREARAAERARCCCCSGRAGTALEVPLQATGRYSCSRSVSQARSQEPLVRYRARWRGRRVLASSPTDSASVL